MRFRNLTGDCLDVLKSVEDDSVQLLITSPPYADARKSTYGGVHPDRYVEWFLPRSAEFKRVLHPKGTFILNIKEKVVDGVRHPYVRRLQDALENQGWLSTEEWIWHKKNCSPGKWPNRFRDAWEHLFQFNRCRDFNMWQDEVRVPVGDWADSRLKSLKNKDVERSQSATGSPFTRNVANWVGRDSVYPTNVLHLATECGNEQHSAVFPVDLPKFFINLFTQGDDLVLDPFAGSGTVGYAALDLNRRYLGIDILPENTALAEDRLTRWKPYDPEQEKPSEKPDEDFCSPDAIFNILGSDD